MSLDVRISDLGMEFILMVVVDFFVTFLQTEKGLVTSCGLLVEPWKPPPRKFSIAPILNGRQLHRSLLAAAALLSAIICH